MTEPEKLERERASDVPEDAQMRADGSYTAPAITEMTDEEIEKFKKAEREQAAQDSPPREQGTKVPAVSAP